MKRLLLFVVVLCLSLTINAQTVPKFTLNNNTGALTSSVITANTSGTLLKKGDMFDIWVHANLAGNYEIRNILFDLQFQNTAFEFVSATNTGTAGSGGILPGTAQISVTTNNYPGYNYVTNESNNVTDGSIRYQYGNYYYSQTNINTINRTTVAWTLPSTNTQQQNTIPYDWGFLRYRFKLKADAVGMSFNPLVLNFAAAFDVNGAYKSTFMREPLTASVILDQNYYKLVKAKLHTNENYTKISEAKVSFYDTAAKVGHIFNVTSDSIVNIDQAVLKPSTVYRVHVMGSMDQMTKLYNAAVTVSDFTAAVNEFTSANLDKTFSGSNIKTGAGWLAADVNRSNTFDLGDVNKIFAQSVAYDSIVALPTQYTVGTNGYMSLMTFRDSVWKSITADNWYEQPKEVYIRTKAYGDSAVSLNLNYLLFGDINRSHSSQVYDTANNLQVNSLDRIITMSLNPINAGNNVVKVIDVSLNNTTVTSNNIEIPVNVAVGANKLSGLQFEFEYDAAKIKFESIASALPNTWFTFVTVKEGRVKFGAVNKDLASPVTGSIVPFTLKFSSPDGLNLTSAIRVTEVMDASDDKGNQLGIKLNTTTIKLTGYNYF